MWWTLFAVTVFLCILLHEYGHALMARRYGVETQDIILLPFGGMARLNRLPEKPVHEFLVALAGPLTNLLIALFLFPFFWFITKPQLAAYPLSSPENLDDDFFLFLPLIIFMNVLLAIFNLIPAFPMDGGRMLRALLSLKTNRLRATKVAVAIGIVIAIFLGFYGIAYAKWLYVFLGLFIVNTAMKEYRWVKTESLLESYYVKDVIKEIHQTILLDDYLSDINNIAESTERKEFIALNETGTLCGVLDLKKIPEKDFKKNNQVKDFYTSNFFSIDINDTLKTANYLMQKKKVDLLMVMKEEKPFGVLEENMIWDFIEASSDYS